MRQQKPRDCFHKIVTFQVHKDCHEFAAICQNTCQKIHRANFPPCTVPMNVIQDHFSQIKNRLIEVLKVHTLKLSKEYEQVMKDFQKRYTENVKQMEKEMLSVLIRVTNMNKDVLDKIENQRLEKLKCSEIYNYLQDRNDFQARIKSAPLSPIYQKHLNSLKSHYKNLNFNLKNQQLTKSLQSLTPKTVNNELIQVQGTLSNKKKAQQKLDDLKTKPIKKQSLKIKTWDILKVRTQKRLKTKPISKNQSENKQNQENNEAKETKQTNQIKEIKEPKEAQQVTENQQKVGQKSKQSNQNIVSQEKPIPNEENNSDSDDFIDFIQKRKNQV